MSTLQTFYTEFTEYVHANPDAWEQEAAPIIARLLPQPPPAACKAKPARVVKGKGLDVSERDTATMTDAEVRAYYKARQYYDDAVFLARVSTVTAVQTQAAVLATQIADGTLPRTEHAQAITRLRREARTYHLTAEIAATRQRQAEEDFDLLVAS